MLRPSPWTGRRRRQRAGPRNRGAQPLKLDRKNPHLMTGTDALVIVLDDELPVRQGLARILDANGFCFRLHAEPAELYEAGLPPGPCCLLLDHQLGGDITGVDVHAEIQRRGWCVPTVFLTAHWSVESVVRAMRAGADGFLTKPYEPAALIAEVREALERSRTRLEENKTSAVIRARAAALTEREREVVRLVLGGLLNKEVADRLGLALVTVKLHRGNAMRKLGISTAAELARLAPITELFQDPPA